MSEKQIVYIPDEKQRKKMFEAAHDIIDTFAKHDMTRGNFCYFALG